MVDGQGHARKTESDAQAGTIVALSPCAMVIFGAAGDLTKRLVVPAHYNLVCAKRPSEQLQLVGVDLVSRSTADWRRSLTEMMNRFVAQGDDEFQVDQLDQAAWRWLTDRMMYLQGDLNDPEAIDGSAIISPGSTRKRGPPATTSSTSRSPTVSSAPQ